jgi:zinc/manganese transport system substrate-binding protein
MNKRGFIQSMLTLATALMLSNGMAFAQSGASTPQAPKKVVASFSILGDLVKNIARDRVQLTMLVGANGDAHVYSPTPNDAKTLSEADMVVINGLGFEGWINRLMSASKSKAVRIVASEGIKPLKAKDDDHGHAHGHSHGASDPHAWQNVMHVKTYVKNIRDALIKLDPEGRAVYESNAASYSAQLDQLDAEIKAQVNALPAYRRRILTSHDAFAYFGTAYGLEMMSVQGVSTDAEASAKDVASMINQIKKNRIPAIFVENISDPRLMDRIAKETGAKVGGKLYSDALSDASGSASTYILMMRHNIKTLSEALKAS